MSVGIFLTTAQDSLVSQGTALNPIVFKFTQAGGNTEKQVFLRHEHLSGPLAESSTNVSVDPVDLSGSDESTWLQIAPDSAGVAGTYGAAGASVNLGNVNLGATVPFWIKATVPANTEVGARDDVALSVASTGTRNTKTVDISTGTFTPLTEYDTTTNKIKFTWAASTDTGQYLTPWLNVAAATAISEITYTLTGGAFVYIYYRTATDSSGTSATDWFTNPADLDLSKDYLQIRLDFFAGSGTGVTTIANLHIVYSGSITQVFDVRFYDGPATPELISPANGSSTEEFNPLLTAVSENCDQIQFQLDNVTTFNSSYLETWIETVASGVEVSTQSPEFDRPSGTWYWRARSGLGGVWGNWSDYWVIIILPLASEDVFMYLNSNVGFEQVDTITHNRWIYLNVNQGNVEDTLYRPRHVYLNVNVNSGIGEVIYPIYDRTETRKQTFTIDSEAF